MTAKHVVVCGGGVVGLFCAYYLKAAGHDVTVLEKHSTNDDSCASGSAGYISPSHVIPLAAPGVIGLGLKWMLQSRSPFYVKPRMDRELIRWGWHFLRSCSQANVSRGAPVLAELCLRSRSLFLDFDRRMNNRIELRQKGLLNLCKTQQMLDHEAQVLAKLANELGVEAKVLNARETSAVESGTDLDVVGSIYFPNDAHLTPQLVLRVLTEELKNQGVIFRFDTTVQGWRMKGNQLAAVITTDKEIEADEFVLAGGAWSPAIVDNIGLRLPMQAGKGYSLTLPASPLSLTTSLICAEKRLAVTPMGRTLRFGGTMEISGINSQIRPERVQQIIESAISYFPRLRISDFDGVKPWCGLRPVSPDGLPYIGRFGRIPNLIAACGHAMLGLTLAPVTGQMVAEIVSAKVRHFSSNALSPDRFA